MRFLLATDGSRGADIALDFLGALPLSYADHVVVLTVPTYSFVGNSGVETQPADTGIEHGESAARAIAERARTRLSGRGISVAVDIAKGPVADAIEAATLRHAAEMVVLGSRGLGAFAGTILGSVARALARHASLPILVVRERREAPSRIILAVDGSDESGAAVALLARLPLPTAARITLMRVIGTAADADAVTRVIDRAQRALDALSVDREITTRGHAAEEILARAREGGADLIVLGSHGQAAGGLLRGSLADQVLSQAHCAVLVAKAPVRPGLVAERHAPARHMVLAL
jgi:nucleotide-binding universal stress UspA family protein